MCKIDAYNHAPNHIDQAINYVNELVEPHFMPSYPEEVRRQLIQLFEGLRPFYNAGLMWYHNEMQKKEALIDEQD